jgi:soluble lytic murein transglycosylase-like protein
MRQAIDKQRAAIRKQAESTGAWLIPGDPPTVTGNGPSGVASANCDPLAEAVVAPIIETNAKTQSVKPELLRAVMEQESGLRPCAISSKGAQGLMQLMPSTAQELGVSDIFDPKENVAAGAKLLKQLVDKYNGDLSKALAAYNAGATAVDLAGGVPDIQETKDYVDAILKKLAVKPAAPQSIPMPKPIGN